jgi:hypothetical protein
MLKKCVNFAMGVICVAVLGLGCGGGMVSVPVTPAPLAPEKAAALKAALSGSWKLVDEMQQGGTRKKVSDTTTMTFAADGSMSYNFTQGISLMSWGAHVGKKYSWSLDGANLHLKPDFLVMRVDAWTPTTLEVFVYAFGYHWYFERLPEQPKAG